MDYLILNGAALGYYVWVGAQIAVAAYVAYKGAKKIRNAVTTMSLKKKIKEKTFDANNLDEQGRTPLMKAYNAQQTEMMINEGIDVNARDKNGMTALMYAAERGDAKSVQLLLDAGAEKDAQSNAGYTALMLAAISGNEKTLETLGNAGANPNITNNKGETALMFLAERGYFWKDAKYNRMNYLISIGADWNMKDNSGRTALDRYIDNEKSKDQYEIDGSLVKLLSRNPDDIKREQVKKTMSLQSKKNNHRIEDIENTPQEIPHNKEKNTIRQEQHAR